MEDPLAQPWDESLKKLVHADPQAFVHLVDPTATFLHEMREQLKPLTKEVDGLLLTRCENGAEELIHVELQSSNDAEMHDRMLVYHVLARTQYKLPIRSCVIYLRQDGNVPQPPHHWTARDGQKTIDFYSEVIELAKLSTAQLRAFGEIGLLPLVPLTKDGANRETVEEMFTDLQQAGK